MSQNTHLNLEGNLKKKIHFFCFSPMTDLNLSGWGFISLAFTFQRSLHHSVYFVLGGRLNMHELSSILGLDGPL